MNVSGKRRCPQWICLIGVCIVLLLLCACDTVDPLPVEGDKSDYTEEEIAFLEAAFGREISTIEQKHLNSVETLSIVGDRILRSEFLLRTCTDTEYMYEDEMVPYDMECAPDLSLLRLFPNLKSLGVYCCPALTDVSGLAALQRLESLTIYMSSVTDLSVLASMPELMSVQLRGTPVKTLTLAEHNHLTSLTVINGALTDLSFLERCPLLTTLCIEHNTEPLRNTEWIPTLTALSYLNISAPETDFSFLKDITAPVKSLSVGGTADIDLNMSETLRQSVMNLYIRNSSGIDLAPLDAFASLRMLFLFAVQDYTDPAGVAEKVDQFVESEFSSDLFNWWKPEV